MMCWWNVRDNGIWSVVECEGGYTRFMFFIVCVWMKRLESERIEKLCVLFCLVEEKKKKRNEKVVYMTLLICPYKAITLYNTKAIFFFFFNIDENKLNLTSTFI